MRIGFGYDVHKLVKERPLILGGVSIPYELGLLGHSDADVLTHSLMDAILGSLALGDIGKLFPDTDEKYKDANSITLLKEVNRILNSNNYKVNNVDITVVCQAPKLAPFIDEMRKIIADTLNTDISYISIKATTTEHLGFIGRGEGISSYAVCSITQI